MENRVRNGAGSSGAITDVDAAAAQLAALGLGGGGGGGNKSAFAPPAPRPLPGDARPSDAAALPRSNEPADASSSAAAKSAMVNVAALVSRGRAAKANGDLATALRCFEAAHRALPEDEALKSKVIKLRARMAAPAEPAKTPAAELKAQPQSLPPPTMTPGAELKAQPQPVPTRTPAAVPQPHVPPTRTPVAELKAASSLQRSVSSASALEATVAASGSRIDALPNASKLYPHQRQGVAWMLELFDHNRGGILGDDMGLGKTIQVISLLRILVLERKIRSVLIVMPTVLIENWVNEFSIWFPTMRVKVFHGSTTARQREIDVVHEKGGVCLTTYGTLRTSYSVLSNHGKFTWDYAILDEGHIVKNPAAQVSQALRALPAKHKLLLTGTPLQNNLKELWTLFDYVCDTKLLRTYKEFKSAFEDHILRANDKGANADEQFRGRIKTEKLRELIRPHFLRREKKAIFGAAAEAIEVVPAPLLGDGSDEAGPAADLPTPMPAPALSLSANGGMPPKKELVVWTRITELQLELYRAFLATDRVSQAIVQPKSMLATLGVLLRLCCHPALIPQYVVRADDGSTRLAPELPAIDDDGENPLEDGDAEGDEEEDGDGGSARKASSMAASVGPARTFWPLHELLDGSSKLVFVRHLLPTLVRDGHRVLLFSQSKVMLDLTCCLVSHLGLRFVRMDGDITDRKERQKRINEFQRDNTIPCFVLTTGVGGVGLNLVGADRVILMDPAWNPAKDAQAVDRAYRMGQTRPVIVYRLNTCGTVEEKVFRRQVFKAALMRNTTTKAASSQRYFTKDDLKALFTLGNSEEAWTHRQLIQAHGVAILEQAGQPGLIEHIDQLKECPVVYAVSDHDLLSSRTSAAQAEADAKMAAFLAQDPDDVRAAKPSRSKRPPTAPPTSGPGVPIPVGGEDLEEPRPTNFPSRSMGPGSGAASTAASPPRLNTEEIEDLPPIPVVERGETPYRQAVECYRDHRADGQLVEAADALLDALDLNATDSWIHDEAQALGRELGWL